MEGQTLPSHRSDKETGKEMIDNFRFSKDYARYPEPLEDSWIWHIIRCLTGVTRIKKNQKWTRNFTPPTEPYNK